MNSAKELLKCRFTGKPLKHVFADLGMTPLANSYLTANELNAPEVSYPLKVYVSESPFLVQLPSHATSEQIFSDYLYFSSFSKSWLTHCKDYASVISQKLELNSESLVMEVASNDGYLLQYFKERNIPVLGIEPAKNVARVAIENGIETDISFFGKTVAQNFALRGKKADLLIANNVIAHVPDLNDFLAGFSIVLKDDGVITAEFPHLLRMIERNEFDTIYHEHFSYFSFATIQNIFDHHGIRLFDVEELKTHGGSIRVYGCKKNSSKYTLSPRVSEMIERENEAGLGKLETYLQFGNRVNQTKRDILLKLIEIKNSGKSIVGYGAPAKGNTLLNFCGIGKDFLDYTVDISPHKQGCYLPGTHVPIFHPDKIKETEPDYLMILPWNLKDEIVSQMSFVREWGGKFIVPIPQIQVVD